MFYRLVGYPWPAGRIEGDEVRRKIARDRKTRRREDLNNKSQVHKYMVHWHSEETDDETEVHRVGHPTLYHRVRGRIVLINNLLDCYHQSSLAVLLPLPRRTPWRRTPTAPPK